MEDDLRNYYTIVPGYELGTYTWESLPVEMHWVQATAAHFHEVTKRSRLIVSSRDRSMPLPPMKGAIPHTHSREDLVPIEEPKGSTIPAEFLFSKVERKRGKKDGEGKT